MDKLVFTKINKKRKVGFKSKGFWKYVRVWKSVEEKKKKGGLFICIRSEWSKERQLATDIFAFISGDFVNSSQPDFFEIAIVPADTFYAMYLLQLTFVLRVQPVFISFRINSGFFGSRSFENKNHLIG